MMSRRFCNLCFPEHTYDPIKPQRQCQIRKGCPLHLPHAHWAKIPEHRAPRPSLRSLGNGMAPITYHYYPRNRSHR